MLRRLYKIVANMIIACSIVGGAWFFYLWIFSLTAINDYTTLVCIGLAVGLLTVLADNK